MMSNFLDKYIQINNLSDPEKVFNRLDGEFIDVMYPDHFSEAGVIMLLDVNIDPHKKEDMTWLKDLLNNVLTEIGETTFFLTSFDPDPAADI